MIVYVNTVSKKRKSKKPTTKQLALRQSWAQILAKYDTPATYKSSQPKVDSTPIRHTTEASSLITMAGNCNKPQDKVYTGNAIIGLSTMHKSNIVPVFSQAEAIAHAKMRRG